MKRVKASQVEAVHRKYIGLTEMPPNSNDVIFNTRYYGREVRDGDRPGARYPWCVTFARNPFSKYELDAEDMFPATASCGYLRGWAIERGMWIDDPKDILPGDYPIFDFEDDGNLDTDHIGFCVANLTQYRQLKTIEGNTGWDDNSNGGEVMERNRSYAVCIGAYRPAYAAEDAESEDEMFDINKLSDDDVLALWNKIQAVAAKQPTSDYAKAASEKGVTSKLFSDGDKDLLVDAPQQPLKRQDLAVVLDRMHALDKQY